MDFDAIVIGSGAGGGTLAGELASRGRRVLLVERGNAITDRRLDQDERAMFEARIASDDRPFVLNGQTTRPIVGGLPGGSTALFGAVMMRPTRADFIPGEFYPYRIPDSIWEWPIGYEDLAPHLDRAEDLYGVAGDTEQRIPYLAGRDHPYEQKLPDLEPINQRLRAGFEAQGLKPFGLPLAIDFARCRRCPACPGMLCPHDARGSSIERAEAPRLGRCLEFLEGAEATRIEWRGRRVEAVWIRTRENRQVHRLTANVYVSSAGALGSPALLLESEVPDQSGELGRNHMCHLGALSVALFHRRVGSAERFVKQLGLMDDYLGCAEIPAKLGMIQQIPVPGPWTLAKRTRLPLPRRVAQALGDRMLVFAGTLEDLPDRRNRVRLASDGGIRLDRNYRTYDIERGRAWSRRIARLLREAGADHAIHYTGANVHDHLAHQVGTCRFGHDPKTSVLDANCRVHALDNLYVVDGSFMPTSLGVGPALTIAANALRVADVLDEGGIG